MLHLLILEPTEKEQKILPSPGFGLIDFLELFHGLAARVLGLSQVHSRELYVLQHFVESSLLEVVVEGGWVCILGGQATVVEVELDICIQMSNVLHIMPSMVHAVWVRAVEKANSLGKTPGSQAV